MARSAERVPPLFARLVDDAGLFPPAALPMEAALLRHHDELAAGNPLLTGRFVCTVDHATIHRRAIADAGVRLSLVVDVTDVDQTLRLGQVAGEFRSSVEAVEIDLTRANDADAFARAIDAVRLASGVDELYVEVGWGADVAGRLALAARCGAAGKLRCGGVWEASYPSVTEVASALSALAREGTPWKATAGLHRAVRGVDPRDGLVHHGFLNLLVATEAATRQEPVDRVAELVATGDVEALVAIARGLTPEAVARTRASLVSYGSCDVREPLDELSALRLTGDRNGNAGTARSA